MKERIFVLANDETKDKLEQCKKVLGMTTSDVVRKGIDKVLCEINAERTDIRMINILEELANNNLNPNSRYYRRNTGFDLAIESCRYRKRPVCRTE